MVYMLYLCVIKKITMELKKIDDNTYNIGGRLFKAEKRQKHCEYDTIPEISGFYVSSDGRVISIKNISQAYIRSNVFLTRPQAEASIALAKISQLVPRYGSGVNYVISYSIISSKFDVSKQFNLVNRLLGFEYEEMAQRFLEDHGDLLEAAKSLLV